MVERINPAPVVEKKKGGALEKVKTFNKITLVGSTFLAAAGVGFAMVWAATDVAQLYGINKFENWRDKKKNN